MEIRHKKSLFILSILVVFISIFTFLNRNGNTLASSYDESGLVVSGSHSVVTASQIKRDNRVKLTFTFKTTDSNYKGFICGGFVLKYDPARMSIDSSSISQVGGITGVNPDYNLFKVNGVPAKEGMILVTYANTLPGQNYDLTVDAIDLFKDGSRDPLQVEIVNRSEDQLCVMDINDKFYKPSSPIIRNATITLVDMKINIEGDGKIQKGKEAIYKANLTNALLNQVTWSIKKNQSALTTIDSEGRLKVSIDENATSIEVIATSKEDPSVSVSKTVTITDIPLINVNINGSSEVTKGTSSKYLATVLNALNNDEVVWSIEGNKSSTTNINSKGELTVDIKETANVIKVVATSKEDNTAFASQEVKLLNPPLISIDIQGKKQAIKGTKGNHYTSSVSNTSNQAVSWSIIGAKSNKTQIDDNGDLVIGIDESSKTIQIVATSLQDRSISNKITITLIDKTYTVADIKLQKESLNLSTKNSKQDLYNEAEKIIYANVRILTNDGKSYIIELPIEKYDIDKSIISADGYLKKGEYSVLYQVKFPYLSIDENGKITKENKETNISGKDSVRIPLYVKYELNTINKPNIKTTDTVKTSDETMITSNLVLMISSWIVSVYLFSKKRITN